MLKSKYKVGDVVYCKKNSVTPATYHVGTIEEIKEAGVEGWWRQVADLKDCEGLLTVWLIEDDEKYDSDSTHVICKLDTELAKVLYK